MQVLLCGCQIPPFRLRWLKIVWSIGEKESHEWIAGEEVFHHIWDGSSLYTHAGTTALIIWDISTAFLCIFQLKTILYSPDFSSLLCLSPLILHWHTSHRADLMYGVYKLCLCQFISPLPYKMLCCMFSFISLPALSPFFSSARGSYTPSVCFVGWLAM